jgi:hypothetical protein
VTSFCACWVRMYGSARRGVVVTERPSWPRRGRQCR